MSTRQKFFVVGMGPGGENYMIPAASKAIRVSEILIGAPRHLILYRTSGKELLEIKGNFDEILDYIETERHKKIISVLVSGDPGLYSYLGKIKKRFSAGQYDVIPGLSSMQIACARVSETWQDALIISVHGRSLSILEQGVTDGKKLIIFCDKKNNPSEIAGFLLREGFGDRKVYIAQNLSYPDEKIIETSLEKTIHFKGKQLCIMIVK